MPFWRSIPKPPAAAADDPAVRQGTVREHPVVEFLQTPTAPFDEAGVKFFHLQAAEEIAHRNSGAGRIPVHIRLRAGGGETHAPAEHRSRAGRREGSLLQAAIDHDAVRAPERVVELGEFGARTLDEAVVDGHFLAPHRPALVKNRMREEAAPTARVVVLDDELQVVARVALVNAGQLEAVVLADLRGAARGSFLVEAEVVHPKNPRPVLGERPQNPKTPLCKLVVSS